MSEPDDLPEEHRLPARLPRVPPGYAIPGAVAQGYVPRSLGHLQWRPPTAEIPADPREALPSLWEQAGETWQAMWLAFGDVAFSIAGDAIKPLTHKLMGDWVRNVELLVRRIIIIAALTLELAPLKPRSSKSAPQPVRAPRAPQAVTPDNPETWKTSFRLFPRAFRTSPPRHARRATGSARRPTARGYALRIEALRRVIGRREACAIRAARRFQRIAAANRSANQPRAIEIAPFSFHPRDRTTGKHAIAVPMRLAQPLAFRVTDDWNRRYVEPG
jgi:hypothetical protein